MVLQELKVFLDKQEEESADLLEVTSPFFETVKYVLCDIPCLPKDMQIFQSGSFFYVVHNEAVYLVERMSSDTEVLYQCVYKYNTLTGERLAP